MIPFLGAGASIVGRTEGQVWNPAANAFPPNGSELAHFLAEKDGASQKTNLYKSLQQDRAACSK